MVFCEQAAAGCVPTHRPHRLALSEVVPLDATERESLVLAMIWLKRNPELLSGIVTAARLDMGVEADHDSLKREVERYFQSGVMTWCSRCFQAVMAFADGERIGWPSRTRHTCKAERSRSEPQPIFK